MNIYITLDYELFFGYPGGSSEKCILEPSEELFKIAEQNGARFTWFADAGYLFALEKFSSQYPSLQQEYQKVSAQLKTFSDAGHDVQLHIHPHWEKSYYDGASWVHSMDVYKFADMPASEIEPLMLKYKAVLEKITGKNIQVYRAGGWCLQPFEPVNKAFEKSGIKLDSTVYRGGVNTTSPYYYDFRNVPSGEYWRFENDLCIEEKQGKFIELPISEMTLSPLFFWKLFLKGKMNPEKHRPIGNGKPVHVKGMLRKYLSSFSVHPVSIDGYFSSQLEAALRSKKRAQQKHLVVIGHPKACTAFSMETLRKFVEKNKHQHRFITLSEFLKEA